MHLPAKVHSWRIKSLLILILKFSQTYNLQKAGGSSISRGSPPLTILLLSAASLSLTHGGANQSFRAEAVSLKNTII